MELNCFGFNIHLRRIIRLIFLLRCVLSFSQDRSEIPEGELIFYDNFERNESQELKDEVGNRWTTSSNKTAKGNKQVDLRNGTLYIYTHKEANHATSVRHKMGFKNGAITLDFKLDTDDDVLNLNIADPACKSVHAGHLISVVIKSNEVELIDLKTGVFDLKIKKAREGELLTVEQKELLKRKKKKFKNDLKINRWHKVTVKINIDTIWLNIDDIEIGTFVSEGFAHDSKDLLRILVPKTATVDNVKIWKK